jgi:hypothetical protein
MNTRIRTFACALLVSASLAAGSVRAADDQDLKKDLASVIALQGYPCGEVVDVTVLGDNDYNASCKDSNKYHVYLNPNGRVIVEKRSE